MPQDNPAMGLLKENGYAKDKLGPVNRAIITDQFHRLLFGRNGYYWRSEIGPILAYAPEIMRTTWGRVLKANLPDAKFKKKAFKA